jgi:hypothetical protein
MAIAGFTCAMFSEIDEFILCVELHYWQKEGYNTVKE